MHSVGSINIPLLLGIIIILGAFFLVYTNISIHAFDKKELILYDYDNLAELKSSNIFGISVPDTDTDTAAPDTDTAAPDTDTDTDTAAPDTDTDTDTDTAAPDDEENILINQLVRTGKFTEDEATEFVTKVIKNGTNVASTADDTLDSDSSTTSETDTSTNDTTPSITQNSDDESSSNTNNPEEYDDLNGLVSDIKNGDIDTDEISLDAFQDSGAYQGTDKETQDCIDLAGKIGRNLGDSEIVHCFDDANYFRDKYPQVSVPQDKVTQPIPELELNIPETNTTQQVTEPMPEPEPIPEPNIPETNATQQVTEPIPEPNVAEEYDQLEDLVDDIKNGDLDDDEILLNDFIDSGAYQDADKNIQDCIDLAGKIGRNLGDSEIVHCFDDANYFRDKYP
jgi:polyhydroxyalkanoate synthesis regulator phasin